MLKNVKLAIDAMDAETLEVATKVSDSEDEEGELKGIDVSIKKQQIKQSPQ